MTKTFKRPNYEMCGIFGALVYREGLYLQGLKWPKFGPFLTRLQQRFLKKGAGYPLLGYQLSARVGSLDTSFRCKVFGGLLGPFRP